MTYLVPRMTQREMQKALDALKAPLRFPRAEGGFVPPTEPRDQEHDMTTLNDLRAADRHRQHMALLTAIHDLLDERLPRRGIDLTPQEFTDFLAAAKGEPVDVTEEPPCGSQVTDRDGDVWERRAEGRWRPSSADLGVGMSLLDWSTVRQFRPLRPTTDADRERVGLPVDITDDMPTVRDPETGERVTWSEVGPDVDPDEALARVLRSAKGGTLGMALDDRWMAVARAAREHIEGEQGNPDTWDQIIDHANRRAEKAEAEVERLTRERDDLRGRVDDLIRERGQAIERYRALRQDAVGEHLHARDGSKAEASLAYVLDRDDERGQQ